MWTVYNLIHVCKKSDDGRHVFSGSNDTKTPNKKLYKNLFNTVDYTGTDLAVY